jgi:FkbM family methyltransferase
MPGMDLRFSLDPLETIQMNLYYRQSFQPEIVAWVKRLLVPEALFIDAGANVGIHALVAGEYFRRGGARRTMVYAFEPNPRIFGQLQDNIRLNGLEAIVMAQASGVADVETRREFYLSSRENSASSSLASLGAGHLHTGESVEIETVALSKFVERCAGGGRVGLLKLDVEGAELLALRGARDLLARDRPFVIMEVYPALMRAFGYAFRDARSYLGDLGYALRRIQPDGGLAELLDREWPDAVAYGDVLAYPHGRAAEVVRK